MGMFDKCIFCCGLSREASVKVSTYLVILYYLIDVVLEILYFNSNESISTIISLIVDIGIITSLIFLLLGIKDRKKSYMKQFDTVFGILYIICVIVFAFGFVASVTALVSYILTDKETLTDSIKLLDPEEFKEYENLSSSEIKRTVVFGQAFHLGVITIFMFLFTYYYFFTRKFVIDTIKEIDSENNNRQLEDGNKI